MVEKVIKNVKRNNHAMWDAFKAGCNIHGYQYYEIPPELRYRYPAPGSTAIEKKSFPHLFKPHWKTPFRDSAFNIRPKEVRPIMSKDNPEEMGFLPELDPSNAKNAEYLKQQQFDKDGITITGLAEADLESPESLQAIWDMCASQEQEIIEERLSSYPGHMDLDDDYDQVNIMYNPRGATGFENDAKSKQIIVETERWIEDIVGAQQIKEKKLDVYKGTIKKWQILDDAEHDRDQIVKMQAAVQAPLPEELEMYKEKHSVPMQLPFNNENVTKWRDEPLAIDSADFDPDFLQLDRNRRKKFFLERYEQPKQLTE